MWWKKHKTPTSLTSITTSAATSKAAGGDSDSSSDTSVGQEQTNLVDSKNIITNLLVGGYKPDDTNSDQLNAGLAQLREQMTADREQMMADFGVMLLGAIDNSAASREEMKVAGREYALKAVLMETLSDLMWAAEATRQGIITEDNKKKYRKRLTNTFNRLVSSLKKTTNLRWFEAAAQRHGGVIREKYDLLEKAYASLKLDQSELQRLISRKTKEQKEIPEERYETVFGRIETTLGNLVAGIRRLNASCFGTVTYGLAEPTDLVVPTSGGVKRA